MPKTILTIGNFDGVHVGHQALIARACALRDQVKADRVMALVFDPSPQVILTGRAPERLSTFVQRAEWLCAAGADVVERLEPTRELLSLDPDEFVLQAIARWNAVGFVEGTDFCFGKARAGNAEMLCSLASRFGSVAEIVPPVEVALNDHHVAQARSSLVRWLIAQGRVSDAARVLGRPYQLLGTVVQGDRRGRTIGFPTANLRTELCVPADGVYAARATLPDGRSLAAALSVGTKPTFGRHERTVEAFLFDPAEPVSQRAQVAGTGETPVPPRGQTRTDETRDTWRPIDGLDEYGWMLRLDLLAWVRDQARFASLPELLAQLSRDCARVREIVETDRSRHGEMLAEAPA